MKNFLKKFFMAIYRYLLFFFLVGFSLTCNIMLFLSILQRFSHIELGKAGIAVAAIFTLCNTFLIALIFAIFDYIRRKISVSIPVNKILQATQKITQGDFSVRIKPTPMSHFTPIINDLNKMAAELEGIETLKTDFIASVSHELKTPLAVLSNYGTLLTQPKLEEEKRVEYAEKIVQNSSRLSDLISNILKLNKLENQIIHPEFKKCSLSENICECLLLFENEWEKKKIDIETDIESDVFIYTDPEMLNIVWNNLFSNALKFTPDGGKITVTLKEDDEKIYASVKDTGCGMDTETGRHIFEKFYQGDTSRSTQGNGLGLALVKRIAEILNADILVESTLGKGSTFTVCFNKK